MLKKKYYCKFLILTHCFHVVCIIIVFESYIEFDLKYRSPDEAGVYAYLCDEKGFNKERIEKALLRLKKTKGKGAQKRMDSFFKPIASTKGSLKRKMAVR